MVGGSRGGLVLALLVPALLALPGSVRGQEEVELDAQRDRLERLQDEIRRRRAEAERLGEREQSVLGELREVERELGVTRQLLETLEQEIAVKTREIERLTRELARAQDRLVVQRQILARRLRSIYKLGRFGTLEILLRSDSFAFLVSDTCSGLSSLLSLLTLAALLMHVATGSVPGRAAVLMSVLPIVVLANTTRVVSVLFVAAAFGQEAALGFFHGASSLLLFGLSLGGLLLICRVTRCLVFRSAVSF